MNLTERHYGLQESHCVISLSEAFLCPQEAGSVIRMHTVTSVHFVLSFCFSLYEVVQLSKSDRLRSVGQCASFTPVGQTLHSVSVSCSCGALLHTYSKNANDTF